MESPLELEDRHVREGKQRVVNQRNLIAKLEQNGHDDMLPGARELLAQFEEFLQLAQEGLERQRVKVSDGIDGPI